MKGQQSLTIGVGYFRFKPMEESLILASASPRRRELLRKSGLSFDVVVAEVDERLPAHLPLSEAVMAVAVQKATWVSRRYPRRWVLAADTVVALEGEVFLKPESAKEAVTMLKRLSGRSHEVLTGYCLQNLSRKRTRKGVEKTIVTMRRLRQEEIDRYVESGEPFDKAGGYAIQEAGGAFITRIYGSYSNVVGLPLAEVVSLLLEEGVMVPWKKVA